MLVPMSRSIAKVARRLSHLPALTRGTLAALRGAVVAYWFKDSSNWGDALNPVLIKAISHRAATHSDDTVFTNDGVRYSVIGSVLHRLRRPDFVVWGSGFITGDRSTARSRMHVRPRSVRAVRGPLTRERLLEQGISCPKVYGDPALLYPAFYRPEIEKRFRIGIVPHYADFHDERLQRFRANPETPVIDMLGGVNDVVDDALACECIASSSLHGLVLACAYGIPAVWMSMSDRLVGDGFKFRDFFASLGYQAGDPFPFTSHTTADDLIAAMKELPNNVDLDSLLDACPFGNITRHA